MTAAVLALALLAAPAARAAEPTVSFDDRVDLDGMLQLTRSTAPEGFVRPPEAFASDELPAGAWSVPASSVP